MSPDPLFEPKSKLGRQLLTAGRDDEPPEASTQRALDQVESAYATDEPTKEGRRWSLWALPAAAVLLGGVLLVLWTTPPAENPVAEPVVTTASVPAPTATAAATATAKVATRPPATASASASATGAVVATRPPKGWKPKTGGGKTASGGKASGSPATTKPPAKSACGCAAADMMCQMRCTQK
ncbi:MAG: hypothetical protein JRI68_17875 [Deltaproteobacteria bacterium]|nr:hypothetical protein [Deltaproteobacteria bacterium]